MKKLLFMPLALLFAFPAALHAKPLDVGVILDLLDSGVSEASIQRFVERNQLSFHLTADDLMDLKKAGASDGLIEYLQEREGGASRGGEGASQTSPAAEYEEDGTTDAVAYTSPDVYLGFGFGFGYPYYAYPDYYYPAYPIYDPCHYYGNGHTVIVGGGGGRGTGVYSYWYRNHARGRPRSSSDTGESSPTRLSGRVLRTAPSPGTAPHVTAGRGSVPSRPSMSAPSRSFHGGMGGSRGGGAHGGGRGRR